MGGKFKDGFISAAAGAALGQLGVADNILSRAVIGGTVSVIGGGKFANGAYTAAFMYVMSSLAARGSSSNVLDAEAAKYAKDVYDVHDGELLREEGFEYTDNIDGFGAALYKGSHTTR